MYKLSTNSTTNPLPYHCISVDDDLGLRTLQPNGKWEFHFHPATFEITNFYCYFFNANFHAAFDVYVEDCGRDHCIWMAQDDGFYLYNMGTRKKCEDAWLEQLNIKVVKSLNIKINKIDNFMRGNLYGFCNLIEIVVSLTSIFAWFFSFFLLNKKLKLFFL